ncbi:MAG: LolA family protein [Candidatus Acidiferrales bacterium]
MRKILAAGILAFAMSLVAHAQTPAAMPEKTIAKAPAPSTPTTDQILNRYVEALGGSAAWRKLTSRVSTGTIEVPKMQLTGTVEIREKAPNRLLRVIVLNGATFRQGFDGTTAWTDDPQDGLRSETGAELEDTRFDADFFHPLDLRKLYSKFTVLGTEKIGEHDVYVVEAARAGNDPDKIFFDTKTGLALRLITHRHNQAGLSVYQEDLEDYREVDGIKLPFVVHQSITEPPMTITLTEVHHNLELDDKEFSKPASE